jgi:hypothetical protein
LKRGKKKKKKAKGEKKKGGLVLHRFCMQLQILQAIGGCS